jgi:hypothetical protein
MLLLGGILAGSVLGLVLVKRWRFETFGDIFKFVVYGHYSVSVFTGINCYFRKKPKKLGKLFLIVISFIYGLGFCNLMVVLIFQSIEISFLKFR